MPLFGSKAPDVSQLEAQNDVPGLVKALVYKPDRQVRVAAAEALKQGLVAKLYAANMSVEVAEADWKALMTGNVAGSRVIKRERIASAQAMVKDLLQALSDSDARVRTVAALSLVGFVGDGMSKPAADDDAAIKALETRRLQQSGEAVNALLAAFFDADEQVRTAARKTIVDLQVDKYLGRDTELVAASLKNADWRVRAGAIISLRPSMQRQAGAAIRLVREALQDRDQRVVAEAATAARLALPKQSE